MKKKKREKLGLFKTKERVIKARPVTEFEEKIIDKNGEQFLGVQGDWHIWDDNGYEYFLDKYSFKARFEPYNYTALDIIHKKNKKKRKIRKKKD